MSQLLTRAFWRTTLGALLRSALAALVPFVYPLVQHPAATWLPMLLTVALAVVVAIATALAGLPDPTTMSWWELALTRALRQVGQMVIAGSATALLLTDVPWSTVLPNAAAAALTTMILAAVQALPKPLDLGATSDGAAVITTVPDTSSTPAAIAPPTGD